MMDDEYAKLIEIGKEIMSQDPRTAPHDPRSRELRDMLPPDDPPYGALRWLVNWWSIVNHNYRYIRIGENPYNMLTFDEFKAHVEEERERFRKELKKWMAADVKTVADDVNYWIGTL